MTACSAKKTCCSGGAKNQTLTSLEDSATRYKWNITGMDCASCAGKIEKAVKGASGVLQVKVAFATERLLVDLDKNQQPEVIETIVKGLGFGLRTFGQPDEEEPIWKSHSTFFLMALLMTLSGILMLINPDWGSKGFMVATLAGLIPFAKKAFAQIRNGTWFGIETLMTVAASGALILGETTEAALVLFLFIIGELLEGFAGRKAKAGIKGLMQLTPDTAWRIEDEKRVEVPADFLMPGEVIEVLPGDRLPVDASLLSEMGVFDESALTGESIPVNRESGEKVLAGCLVVDHPIRLAVVSEPGASAIDRIIRLIEEADERRAPIARIVDRFSAWYTPLVMSVAGLVFLLPPLMFGGDWNTWAYKALALLLIACPCALIISIPAAVTSALTAASRFGALIKGGAALEQMRLVKWLALDKTGTLTKGKPEVTGIHAINGNEDVLLRLAGAVEQGSSHPLAKAIIAEAEQRNIALPEATEVRVLLGRGVKGCVDSQVIKVLAPRHVDIENPLTEQVTEFESDGNTVVVVICDNAVIGLLALADSLRKDAIIAIERLKKQGVQCVMLTGDNHRAAAAIANRLGIDFEAELMPDDKVAAIRRIQNTHNQSVAMVGDGINDAPALKAAEIGIAMGKGSDVALETADAALTHERLTELPNMIGLSRRTARIIRQNIILALGINTLVLLTTVFGITGLMAAVMSDTGSTVLVTLNALRLMRKKDY